MTTQEIYAFIDALSDDDLSELSKAIRDRRSGIIGADRENVKTLGLISAIRLYRDRTGLGLREAVDAFTSAGLRNVPEEGART